MLKQSALRRIMVSTIALIIVAILYFFPDTNLKSIKKTTTYIDLNKTPIYLLNKDDYVIRTTLATKNTDTLSLAKELIEALTIGSEKSEYIPKNFQPIIPKNTRILSIDLNNNLLKINFSKEFLNVSKDNEEKLIEALIYTLTDIPEIKEIMIFIEDTKLNELPQSKINLPNTLNRNFGINKIYDIIEQRFII